MSTTKFFNIDILLISSLDLEGSHEIASSTWLPLGRCFIDHFANDCGKHYCKLTLVPLVLVDVTQIRISIMADAQMMN